MGCPINTITELENSLRYRRQKMVIVILASANSDSRAVEIVLRNFHEMDVLSGDIDFYLPGYCLKHPIPIEAKEYFTNEAAKTFPDFHSSMMKHRGLLSRQFNDNAISLIQVINSHRLGPILFNAAEFTDFVLEFTRRIKGFHYLGGCQAVIIKPDNNGMPDYQKARVIDLDSVAYSSGGPSLDTFLFKTFNIIRDTNIAENKRHINPILRRLFGTTKVQDRTADIIVKKIEALYNEATEHSNDDYRYEKIADKVISDINNCLQYDITTGDFYFISYSSKNTMQAEMLKMLLQHHQIHVWIAPEGIPQGREYPLIIPTTLKLAKVFVLLLTPESARSHWVKNELAIALNQRDYTKIKVVLYGGISIDDIRNDDELHFLLERIQIKYKYVDIVDSVETLKAFIRE